HRLADRPQAPPGTASAFARSGHPQPSPWGISHGFPRLSPAPGQVTHVLLTRPPRSTAKAAPVRLACIRHAASVVPEPGSNSPSRYDPHYGVIVIAWFVRPILVARCISLAHEGTRSRSSCQGARGIASRGSRLRNPPP